MTFNNTNSRRRWRWKLRKGRIFMVVGSGGRDKKKFNGTQEDYIKFRYYESHGILSMEFGTTQTKIY